MPLVVVRDEAGDIRAFINVCRHRGAELVLEEQGCHKSIQCHYHAWTYGLDGSLRTAPGSNYELGFEKHQPSLYPIQVELWVPFIFVNPDSTAPSLAAILGDLPAMVENTGLNLGQIHRRIQVIYDIAANWKVVVDNHLEYYHCPVAHPSFTALIDLHNYELTVHDYFSIQCGKIRESAKEAERHTTTFVVG